MSDREITKLYLKLPPKYRKEDYLKGLEYALYRLVFHEEVGDTRDLKREDKSSGITTRIELSKEGIAHFERLQTKLGNASRIETGLYALTHMEKHPSLYLIKRG